MNNNKKKFGWIFAMFGLAAFVGCGDGRASLTGQVLIEGKPAEKGLDLQFSPVDGSSPSYASTDENGKYEANFTFQKKGIIPGTHSVKLMPGGGDTRMPIPGATPAKKPTPPFPKSHYEEITKIEVKPGSNTIDINL